MKLDELVVNLTTTEIRTLNQEIADIETVANVIKKCKGIVYVVGNGGSDSIANHTVCDLMKHKIGAVAISNANQHSMNANDYGIERMYYNAMKPLLKEDDVVILISSSGQSVNILNAVLATLNSGCKLITFSGFDNDNPLRAVGDYNVYTPSNDYGIVEMTHQVLLHMITDKAGEK